MDAVACDDSDHTEHYRRDARCINTRPLALDGPPTRVRHYTLCPRRYNIAFEALIDLSLASGKRSQFLVRICLTARERSSQELHMSPNVPTAFHRLVATQNVCLTISRLFTFIEIVSEH